MANKHILVVDDDPDMLFLIAHAVKKLGPDYLVSTASNAASAIDQVYKQAFDLAVLDYMMPEMTGVELVPEIRRISPHTQFVIVTAHHDTNRIRQQIEALNINGFVGKPFVLTELLDAVRQATDQTKPTPSPDFTKVEVASSEIKEKLQELHRQTNAWTVLLVDVHGSPVLTLGNKNPNQISRLAAFVATNFLSVNELAALFGDQNSTFRSSYYEGNTYNIYAYNLNNNFFLTVVVGAEVKPGTIWFYTKQIASALADVLPASYVLAETQQDVELAEDFENLLGDSADAAKKMS